MDASEMSGGGGPLAGVTVLDLTRLLPGPFCAWLLRSWGARVVKIEDLEAGDYLREVQPVWFRQLNAGAESVALDLKHPLGREAFLRLVPAADVVLEGFRPGVMDRLGLGFAAIQAANPRVVVTSLSGYATDSELAERAGHDINYLARTGLLSLMNELPPVQLADLSGGLMAAAATLAAVVGARATGAGSHVEASLADAVGALGSLLAAEATAGVIHRRSEMALAGGLACYNIYRTADGGRVALGALEPKFWRRFCEAAARPEWVDRHMDPTMHEELAALFRAHPLAYWAALGEAADCCLEPVRSVAEAAGARRSGQPVSFDGRRPAAGGPVPGRGAHTWQFLWYAGFSEQELQTLAAEGVILPACQSFRRGQLGK